MWSPENFVMARISKDTEAPPPSHTGDSQISCLLAVTADFEIPQRAFSEFPCISQNCLQDALGLSSNTGVTFRLLPICQPLYIGGG